MAALCIRSQDPAPTFLNPRLGAPTLIPPLKGVFKTNSNEESGLLPPSNGIRGGGNPSVFRATPADRSHGKETEEENKWTGQGGLLIGRVSSLLWSCRDFLRVIRS